MNSEFITLTDLVVSNAILAWFGIRLVHRIDDLDRKIDNHETRISLNEKELEYAKEKTD